MHDEPPRRLSQDRGFDILHRLRQQNSLTEYDPGRGVSIATLAYEYPAQWRVTEHAHGADQLIYAASGVMEVSSEQSR